jgi:hypothetical protein
MRDATALARRKELVGVNEKRVFTRSEWQWEQEVICKHQAMEGYKGGTMIWKS